MTKGQVFDLGRSRLLTERSQIHEYPLRPSLRAKLLLGRGPPASRADFPAGSGHRDCGKAVSVPGSSGYIARSNIPSAPSAASATDLHRDPPLTSATTAVALVWSAEEVPAPTDDADANAALRVDVWTSGRAQLPPLRYFPGCPRIAAIAATCAWRGKVRLSIGFQI
jgi:hypothetical protein